MKYIAVILYRKCVEGTENKAVPNPKKWGDMFPRPRNLRPWKLWIRAFEFQHHSERDVVSMRLELTGYGKDERAMSSFGWTTPWRHNEF